jgi:hypothetical protein
MVSAARPFGVGPTAREIADRALTEVGEPRVMFVEALARITALESRRQETSTEEDGAPRSPGRWLKMKQAMKVTGYSRSGLLKLCRQGRVRFDFDGPHRLIDVTSIAPRVRKVRKVLD